MRSVAHLVEQLSDHADFFIVTRNTEYASDKPFTEVEADVWVQRPFCSVKYISAKNLTRQSVCAAIDEIEPDVIYINGIYSWYFSVSPLLYSRKSDAKVVVAARGMLAASAIDIKRNKKLLYLKMAKRLGLFKKVIFQATQAKEVDDIHRALGPQVQVEVAPNLLSVNRVIKEHNTKLAGKLKLVSVMRIAPEKNLSFFLECLRDKDAPEVELDVYGPIYNPDYAATCQDLIKLTSGKHKIELKGPVAPDDLPEILSKADFFLLPTLGENFGHSIVEAWMMGTPVIISDKTPWRHLEPNQLGFDLPFEIPKWIRTLHIASEMEETEHSHLRQVCQQYAFKLANDHQALKANKALLLDE